MNYVVDEAVARKVLCTVDKGLSKGLGVQKPGEMCVEAAVCFAFGMPHNDNPPCVGAAVRAFKIALNDANWSSKAARAKGMRRVAIAQLGSNAMNQRAFAEFVVIQTTRRILPLAFSFLPDVAATLSRVTTLDEAESAAWSAWSACSAWEASAVGSAGLWACLAAARSARSAWLAARLAESAASELAARLAAWSAESAARSTELARLAASESAESAAESARLAASESAKNRILSLAADIAVEALQAQHCEGCSYLFLCEEGLS